jgi:hypothetical protein
MLLQVENPSDYPGYKGAPAPYVSSSLIQAESGDPTLLSADPNLLRREGRQRKETKAFTWWDWRFCLSSPWSSSPAPR